MKEVFLKKNILFLDNKDFDTIQIKILFPFKDKRKYLAELLLLPSMLKYMNQAYDSEEVFQKEKKKNLIIHMGCSKFTLGYNGYFYFDLMIPNTLIVKEDLLEEQIAFFEKMIYHPKIEDGGFSSFELEREKKNLKKSFNNSMKNLDSYHNYRMRKLVDNEGIFSLTLLDHLDLIDKVTEKDLYNFYQELISVKPVVFVMGNVSKKKITNLVEKYLLKEKSSAVTLTFDFNHFLKPFRKKVLEEEEKNIFKDSAFSLIYKVKNMTEDDFIYLGIVRGLLSSLSSLLLDKKLRQDFDLVYSTSVDAYVHYGLLELTAYIHKDNKKIVKEKMLEVMEELTSEELISPLLENLKERFRVNLIRRLDEKMILFEDFIDKELGVDELPEEKYEKLKDITAHDVVGFVKRLELDTIYFLEEEENE